VARLGLRELVNVPPLKPAYGVVYNDILSFKYPINVPGCNGAATSSLPSLAPSLFVAVSGVASTDINNQKRRDEIRTLFNKEIPDLNKHLFSSINFAFFLGRPVDVGNQNLVDQESAKNKDVVQVDMIDNGKNDSMKMAAIFNWVRQYCSNVDVVFKMDENFEIATLKKLGKALTEMRIPGTFVYGVRGDIRPQREGNI
jgi:beta-1,3-galactosyltransferase 5/beta-1,3-galactosyltransferase 1